ncbi:hypothetical protein HAX54_041618 [Datura stramonium]|uniref:Uncharacterized protein n=1 Tax=Datura stramonium TaxID=4076 RepID=A0ABS8VZM5_DATST|nr:hypothetical protein [Datura stramonium]
MAPKQAIKRCGKAKATKRSRLANEQTNSGEEYQLPQTQEANKLKTALSPAAPARMGSTATPSHSSHSLVSDKGSPSASNSVDSASGNGPQSTHSVPPVNQVEQRRKLGKDISQAKWAVKANGSKLRSHIEALDIIKVWGVLVDIIPEAINRYYLGDDHAQIGTSAYEEKARDKDSIRLIETASGYGWNPLFPKPH